MIRGSSLPVIENRRMGFSRKYPGGREGRERTQNRGGEKETNDRSDGEIFQLGIRKKGGLGVKKLAKSPTSLYAIGKYIPRPDRVMKNTKAQTGIAMILVIWPGTPAKGEARKLFATK